MKIVFTVSDCGAAAAVGAEVTRRSAIVVIPDEQLPLLVSRYLEGVREFEERRAKYGISAGGNYDDMSISYVDECPSELNTNEKPVT